MNRRHTIKSYAIAISVLLVVAAAIVAAISWVGSRLLFDYGKLPPARVFRMVFRERVPAGVSELAVAGHGFAQGHTIFMRFHATADAMQRVLKYGVPVDAPQFFRMVPAAARGGKSLRDARRLTEFDRDAMKVRLDEAVRLQHAAYYRFDASKGGQGWCGYMAVDQERKLVYVVAQVL